MEESSLSYKTLKNVSFSFWGYSIPILFSIFITPVVVHKLGTADYGVYVLVNTITGFLLLFDLGLGTSIIKYAAEYHSRGEKENLQSLMNLSNLIFLLFGILGVVVFFAMGNFLLPLFKIPGTSQSHILVVFILAGILFFFNSISMIYGYMARAIQRYDIGVGLSLGQLTLFNILVLIAVLLGFKLKVVLILNIFTIILLILASHLFLKRLLPGISFGYAWSREHVKKIYKFGFVVFITNMSGSALVQLDKLIIPIFLGTSSLTFYSLPGNVAQKVNGITGSSTGIFFPMITSLLGQGNVEKIKEIYVKLFRNISVIAAAMVVPIVFFSHKILLYWLGQEFADKGTGILIILAATHFILAIYGPLINFLLGMGKVRFLMKCSLFMAGLNLVLLFLWIPKYGITGAAYAYLAAVLPVFWMFYWVEKRFLALKGRLKSYMNLYAKILLNSFVFWLLASLYNGWVGSLVGIIIAGPLSVILFFALYKLLGLLEREDWELYKGFFWTILRRLNLIK